MKKLVILVALLALSLSCTKDEPVDNNYFKYAVVISSHCPTPLSVDIKNRNAQLIGKIFMTPNSDSNTAYFVSDYNTVSCEFIGFMDGGYCDVDVYQYVQDEPKYFYSYMVNKNGIVYTALN